MIAAFPAAICAGISTQSGCPVSAVPRLETFSSIARSWLKTRKLSKRLIPLPLPFKFSLQLASACLQEKCPT
jgi:hypothetical protein